MNSSLEHITNRILTQRQWNSGSNCLKQKNQQYKLPPKYGERRIKIQLTQKTGIGSKQEKENFYYEEDSFGTTKNENKTNWQSTYIQETNKSQISNPCISNKPEKSKIQQYFEANQNFSHLQIKNQVSFEDQQAIDESFKNSSMKFYEDGFEQQSRDKKESILYEYFHQTQQSQQQHLQRSNCQSQSEQQIPIDKIERTARALYQYTGKQEKVLNNRIANIDDINQRIKSILDRDIGEFIRKKRISSIVECEKIKDYKSKNNINSTHQQIGNPENKKIQTPKQSYRYQTNQNTQKLQSMVKISQSISNTPKVYPFQKSNSTKYFNKKLPINRPIHMKDFTFCQVKNQQVDVKQSSIQQYQPKRQDSNRSKVNLESYRHPITPIKRQPSQNKGKMIDYEIQKLNNRIRASQQKKQALSICFKPFSVEKRDKSVAITVRSFFQKQTQRKNKNRKINQTLKVQKQQPMRVKSFKDQNKKYLNASQNNHQISKLQRIRDKYSKGNSLKTGTIGKSIIPQQTQRLIKNLRKQVQLDQNFINQKMQLQYCNQSLKEQIWAIIHQAIRHDYSSTQNSFLAKVGQSLAGIRNAFEACIEEHNSFFSQLRYKPGAEQSKYLKGQYSVKKLIETFIEAQTHWKGQIQRKFDRKLLQSERFTVKGTLDMQNKGWIAIEDLVRFVNIGTGQFFRTRDFYLIYKRLVEPMNNNGVTEQQVKSKKMIEYEKFSYEIFDI